MSLASVGEVGKSVVRFVQEHSKQALVLTVAFTALAIVSAVFAGLGHGVNLGDLQLSSGALWGVAGGSTALAALLTGLLIHNSHKGSVGSNDSEKGVLSSGNGGSVTVSREEQTETLRDFPVGITESEKQRANVSVLEQGRQVGAVGEEGTGGFPATDSADVGVIQIVQDGVRNTTNSVVASLLPGQVPGRKVTVGELRARCLQILNQSSAPALREGPETNPVWKF